MRKINKVLYLLLFVIINLGVLIISPEPVRADENITLKMSTGISKSTYDHWSSDHVYLYRSYELRGTTEVFNIGSIKSIHIPYTVTAVGGNQHINQDKPIGVLGYIKDATTHQIIKTFTTNFTNTSLKGDVYLEIYVRYLYQCLTPDTAGEYRWYWTMTVGTPTAVKHDHNYNLTTQKDLQNKLEVFATVHSRSFDYLRVMYVASSYVGI